MAEKDESTENSINGPKKINDALGIGKQPVGKAGIDAVLAMLGNQANTPQGRALARVAGSPAMLLRARRILANPATASVTERRALQAIVGNEAAIDAQKRRSEQKLAIANVPVEQAKVTGAANLEKQNAADVAAGQRTAAEVAGNADVADIEAQAKRDVAEAEATSKETVARINDELERFKTTQGGDQKLKEIAAQGSADAKLAQFGFDLAERAKISAFEVAANIAQQDNKVELAKSIMAERAKFIGNVILEQGTKKVNEFLPEFNAATGNAGTALGATSLPAAPTPQVAPPAPTFDAGLGAETGTVAPSADLNHDGTVDAAEQRIASAQAAVSAVKAQYADKSDQELQTILTPDQLRKYQAAKRTLSNAGKE